MNKILPPVLTCPDCQQPTPLDGFPIQYGKPVFTRCRICHNGYHRERNASRIIPDPSPDDQQTCTKCHTAKPLDQFHKSRTCANGRRKQCIECRNGVRRQQHAGKLPVVKRMQARWERLLTPVADVPGEAVIVRTPELLAVLPDDSASALVFPFPPDLDQLLEARRVLRPDGLAIHEGRPLVLPVPVKPRPMPRKSRPLSLAA